MLEKLRWFSGLRKSTSEDDLTYDIEEEISVLKAPHVLQAPHVEMELSGKYNPKNQMMSQHEMNDLAFRNRVVGQFSDSKMRGLLNAWTSAKNGCDYEEYFDDAKYTKEDEEVAQEAFKEAWKVYFA